MFAMERKKDGTEHFQGICWSETEIKDGLLNLCRSQVRTKLVHQYHQGKKGTYSLVLARNPTTLAKYCNDKEGLGMVTNVTLRERDEIGKWEISRKKTKETKKKLMENRLNDLAEEMKQVEDFQGYKPRAWFFHNSIRAYWDIYGTLPRQTQVEKWMYQVSSEEQRLAFRYDKYSKLVYWLGNDIPQEGYGDHIEH
jgi:hypothetical protein